MIEMAKDIQTDCKQIAFRGQYPGYFRQFFITRGAKTYLISVSNPEYLSQLKLRNRQVDPELRIDNTAYTIEHITLNQQLIQFSEEEICQRLAKTSLEKLLPFLTEQE